VKSAAQLQVLVNQRAWDKEVLLWIGPEKSLIDTLGPVRFRVFDLLDLFDVNNLPGDADETREYLRDRLQKHLKAIPKGPDDRSVLIVKSIGLLARYNVGLKAFYDWFIGSFALAILILDDVADKTEWPEGVRCDTTRLVGYFSEPGMVKDVFSAME
jgi:hypothetical protein